MCGMESAALALEGGIKGSMANKGKDVNQFYISSRYIYERFRAICRSHSTRKVGHGGRHIVCVAHLRIGSERSGSKRIHRDVSTGDDAGSQG